MNSTGDDEKDTSMQTTSQGGLQKAHRTPQEWSMPLKAVAAAQLTALDTNKDGQLSLAESAGMRFRRNLDEQKQVGAGEVASVDWRIASGDYRNYANSDWINWSVSRFLKYIGDDKLYDDIGNDSDWLKLA